MWHEARKQEKKIRGMMVDYRKRAVRRRDFYEKFKADPTQFLQIHGRPCKIHLDSIIAAAGDAASIMMPWQGHKELIIDRFDARAHMDVIKDNPLQAEEELTIEERQLNYERYRILVQNEYLGVSEGKFLKQIHLEEQYGPIALKQTNQDGTVVKEKEKKLKGIAIGFNYDEGGGGGAGGNGSGTGAVLTSYITKTLKTGTKEDEESGSDDSEFDFDLCLNLSDLDNASAHELNKYGQRFGLVGNDFYSYLTNDVEEQESLRLAKEQEEEKAMYSGRKARRERQAFRERRLLGRVMSPPSYAAPDDKSPEKSKSRSRSRSETPENAGEITYITSFGGDDAVEGPKPPKVLEKSRKNVKKSKSKERVSTRRSASPNDPLRRLRSKLSPRRRAGFSRDLRERRRSRSRSRGRNNRSLDRLRGRHRRSPSPRARRRSRSRSHNRRRHSRSRSKTKNTRNDSRASPSPSPRKTIPHSVKTDPSAIPRYYGRHRKNSSSSLEASSDDDTRWSGTSSNARASEASGSGGGRSGGRSMVKFQFGARETPQDRLKKRMQALLTKQFKQDKRLEREKAEQAEQERLARAAELRNIAIRIRRRERSLRHMEDGDDDNSNSVGSQSSNSPRKRHDSLSPDSDDDHSREKSSSPRRGLVDY